MENIKININDYINDHSQNIIDDLIDNGGMYGPSNARKLIYKYNTNLFNNNEFFKSIKSEITKAKVYKKEFKVITKKQYETTTDCINEDCAKVGYNLIKEGYNPVILNLASNVKPCGGYDKGTSAQEESLCYMSTLSQSLYQFGNIKLKCVKECGVKNIPGVYPLDINYGGVYSPNVLFFRNNIDKKYSMRENPFFCSIVTVASLSNKIRNEYTVDENKYCNEDGTLNSEGLEIEQNKIRTIYRIALDNNHDSIVLGAFGCGVYNLLPKEISKLFYDILQEEEFKNKFKKVVFAIYERKRRGIVIGKEGKFKPFYDLFLDNN